MWPGYQVHDYARWENTFHSLGGGGTASLWLLRLQSFIVAKRFVR